MTENQYLKLKSLESRFIDLKNNITIKPLSREKRQVLYDVYKEITGQRLNSLVCYSCLKTALRTVSKEYFKYKEENEIN